MVSTILSTALAMLASVGPSVMQIDETRFRVEVVFDDVSPRGTANAMVSLKKAARKQCKGKGDAVSEEPLEVSGAEPIRKGKEAVKLSEVYFCKPKG